MGIDYGKVRIGLALTDPMRMISRPYKVIKNDPDTILEEIESIIESENVGEIVVGMPFNADGTDSEINQIVREFIIRLKQKVTISVNSIDERFTTDEANDELKKMGYDIGQSKKVVDMIAAAMILRTYLDYQ